MQRRSACDNPFPRGEGLVSMQRPGLDFQIMEVVERVVEQVFDIGVGKSLLCTAYTMAQLELL